MIQKTCILPMISFAVALVILNSGCRTVPTKPPPAEDRRPSIEEELEERLLAEDIPGALESLERYLQESPEDIELKVFQASLLISQREFEAGRSLLDEILSVAPENMNALLKMAMLEGISGNTDEEREILEKLIKLYPDEGSVHSSLGLYNIKIGNPSEAEANFNSALELDPENSDALIGLGNLLLSQKEYSRAEEYFQKGVRQIPDYPFVHSDLSRTLLAQGKFEAALSAINEAIKLNPGEYWFRIDRGRLLLNHLNDAGRALEDFDKAVELDPSNFYAYVFRAGIHYQTGRRRSAILDYQQILELRPDYYFGYRPLGILQYMEEEWGNARNSLLDAYEYEKDLGILLLAGLTYFRSGDNEGGKEYFTSLLPSIPREDPFYSLVRSCFEPGYIVFAIKSIGEIEDDLQSSRMSFYVGAIHQAFGDPDYALEYYQRIESSRYFGLYERKIAFKELESIGGSR